QARSLDGSLGPNVRPRAVTLHREQLDVAHHVLRPARFAGSPCFGPPRPAARGARRHVPRPAGGWQARSLDGSLGPNVRPRAVTLHREQLDVAHHVLRPARFAGSPCFGPPRPAARGARRHVPRPAGGWQARSLDGSLGPNVRPRAVTLHREQLDVAHHVLRPARFAGSPCFGPPRPAARGARRHVPRPAGGWQARSLDGSLGPNVRPRAVTLHREQLDVAHHVLRPARFAGSPCFGPPRPAARGARRHVPRPAGGWQARSLDGSLGPNVRPRAVTLHREQLDVAHHVLRPARFAGSPCFGPPRPAARGARRHVPRPAGGWQARSLDGSLGPNVRPRAVTLHREQLDVAHHVLRPARFAGSPCFGPPRPAARGARRHVPRPAGGWQARSLDGSLGPNVRPRAVTLHREQLDVAHHVLRPARFAGSPCFGPPRPAARGARRHVPRPAGGWQARSLDGSLGPNVRPRAVTLHREQLDVAHHVLRPARFAGSPCFGPPRPAARGARRHVPRPAGGWQARSLDGSLGPNVRPRAVTLHREQLDVAHHVLRPARFAGSPCFGPPRPAARGARRHVPRPAGGWQARSLDGSLGPNVRPRAVTLHREQLDVAHHVLRPARFAGSPCFGPPRPAARGARRHVPRPAGGWQARSLDGSLGPNVRPRAVTLHREQLDVAHHVLRPARFAGSPCFGPPRPAARGARRHVPRPAGGWQARSLDGSLGPNVRPRAVTLHREQLDVAHHVLRPARFAGSPCFGPPRPAARGARRHVPRPAGG
ncbi:hypothetical protein ACJX0J_027070, partial [Zea mays]